MKLGASFPNTQIGNDRIAIRDYAQALEGAGYDYLYCPMHDLGAHSSRFGEPPFTFRPENSGITYTYETPWHELLILYTYLAAHTETIRFVPVVIYLAQRQAPIVAKQMAEMDILSGGRFQPNFGTGWNFTEYEALGMDWETRTARIEEQMQVLKMLWSEPVVRFEGEFHKLDRVGINPLPITQPLPLWYAGSARNVVLRRAARFADGYYALLIPPEEPAMAVERLNKNLDEAGRDKSTFSIVGTTRRRADSAPPIPVGSSSTFSGDWLERAKLWQSLGATHLSVGAQAGSLEESLALTIENKRILDEELSS